MNSDIFPILILNARPGAGKSEIIDYLTKTPLPERQARFHVGQLAAIDDFPMLWTWFEEDAILSRRGYPRLHSDPQGYFKEEYFWHLLIERICQEYDKRLRDHPHFQQQHTTLIEFSRGTEHGGYQAAYQHLSPQILQYGSLMYIRVSYGESLRKNRARANPARPDSLLEHSLSDEKLERLYREDDWETVSGNNRQYLTIKGVQMPYVVFENEDDVTTQRGAALGERLEETLDTLWKRFTAK